MPTYQYACTACGHELEAVQSFADDPLTQCPTCEGRLRKVFASVGIVFKGSGFYRTDSRTEGKAKSESSAESSSTESKPSTESKSPSTTSDSTSSSSKSSPSSPSPSSSGSSSSSSSKPTVGAGSGS